MRSDSFLQLRYIEDIVDSGSSWEIENISNLSKFFFNWKWAIIPWSKLLIPFTSKGGLLIWLDLEINMLAHLKRDYSSLFISILLHFLLGVLQVTF